MEGLKVRVRFKDEADSVILFLEKNGYLRPYSNFMLCDGWVCFNDDMQILCVCNSQAGKELDDYKEITIDKIKDMVVLRRNDPKDANVYQDGDVSCLYDLYLTDFKELYFYHCSKERWILSNLNNDEDYYKLLKPIQKEKNVKEFLNPDQGYKLVCCEVGETSVPDNWIEIPEGMNFAYKNKFIVHFTKLEMGYRDSIVVWQRDKVEVEGEKFDTDEMLADVEVQMATYSQHSHYFKDVRDLNVIDVYQVLKLFNVTDPCLQHIVKKALVVGGRGHKDFERDLKDIHDTSKRALEINNILH